MLLNLLGATNLANNGRPIGLSKVESVKTEATAEVGDGSRNVCYLLGGPEKERMVSHALPRDPAQSQRFWISPGRHSG